MDGTAIPYMGIERGDSKSGAILRYRRARAWMRELGQIMGEDTCVADEKGSRHLSRYKTGVAAVDPLTWDNPSIPRGGSSVRSFVRSYFDIP